MAQRVEPSDILWTQSQAKAMIIRMVVIMLVCLNILHKSAPHGPATLQKEEEEGVVSRTWDMNRRVSEVSRLNGKTEEVNVKSSVLSVDMLKRRDWIEYQGSHSHRQWCVIEQVRMYLICCDLICFDLLCFDPFKTIRQYRGLMEEMVLFRYSIPIER